MVYEDNLLQLFRECQACCHTCTVEKFVNGTFVSITQVIINLALTNCYKHNFIYCIIGILDIVYIHFIASKSNKSVHTASKKQTGTASHTSRVHQLGICICRQQQHSVGRHTYRSTRFCKQNKLYKLVIVKHFLYLCNVISSRYCQHSVWNVYVPGHFLIIKRPFSSQQFYGTGGLNKTQGWRWQGILERPLSWVVT